MSITATQWRSKKWPLWAGDLYIEGLSSAGHFIYVLLYRIFPFGRHFQKDCYHSISQFFGIVDLKLLGRRVPYSNHSVRPSVCLSVKKTNIGHKFFTLRDKSLRFGMCHPYNQTFPTEPLILNLWPWSWPLTYYWKNFNIGHNFLIVRERAFIFGMCVPYDKTFPTQP